jgi:hypothetical protein
LTLYTLEKIKYTTDEPTYKRAIGLYESGKIKQFDDNGITYTAIVQGTHPYKVIVHPKFYDRGSCNCYLGEQDILCKHMVAVAIYAILRGNKIPEEDKTIISQPTCSNKLGELSTEELAKTKKMISNAVKLIKAYSGPSRIWFAYQDSLREGTNRLSTVVSKLPASYQTADLLVKLMIRLDKKLISGGVDDSDGMSSIKIFIVNLGLKLEQLINHFPLHIHLDFFVLNSHGV